MVIFYKKVVFFQTLIRKAGRYSNTAKYNIEKMEFVEISDFSGKELNRLEKIINENIDFIKESMEKIKKGEKVNPIKIFDEKI